jgi:hypothetical protein
MVQLLLDQLDLLLRARDADRPVTDAEARSSARRRRFGVSSWRRCGSGSPV